MTKFAIAAVCTALTLSSAVAADFGPSDLGRIVDMARNQEAKFQRDVKGKTFAGTAKVRSISQNWLTSNYQVNTRIANQEVTCWVKKSNSSKLADIDNGDSVTINGIVRDTVLGDLQVDDCRIN